MILQCVRLGVSIFCFVAADRLLLHDQPVPRRHSDAVLGDEETGNGTHAVGARTVPLNEYTSVIYQQLRTHILLRRNC
jgi:hypothetical protein